MEYEFDYDTVVNKTADALIRASSVFNPDQANAYRAAISNEVIPEAAWVMETLCENATVAEQQRNPMCDDTGTPHVIIELGAGRFVDGLFFDAVREGIAAGLRDLPGRPMAVQGDKVSRLDQSGGLDTNPDAVTSAPFLFLSAEEGVLRLHILMQGGGPELRAKTYRVFHKHSIHVIIDEIVGWATDAAGSIGCTPCTLAIGIGRSHFEASSLMLQAMISGEYSEQSELENEITSRVNASCIGPLGLKGMHTVLATFLKVGPQRASGARIVCMRPCCCVEPRIASVDL
jgi:fumarate hydratase subunit alpha